MLTCKKPQSKSCIWSYRCILHDTVIPYVVSLGMQMRHKPLTTELFCTSSQSSMPSARDEDATNPACYQPVLNSQKAQGLTSDKRHTMMCTKCQLWAPTQGGFSLGKVQHIQYHLTGYIHSLLLSIFQWSSEPQLWRSLAFLASTQDGRAYQMSFLSLIDNGNKSKAITHKILSSLRCCWMSAGTDAFSHKHFRYCFLHFG